MIRVVGIILTIFGAIGFFSNLSSCTGLSYLPNGLGALIVFEAIIPLVTLVFGILGIAFAAKVDKAPIVSIMGIILIVLRVIDLVWALGAFGYLFTGAYGTGVIIGVILGCILPALYIVGAKKAHR